MIKYCLIAYACFVLGIFVGQSGKQEHNQSKANQKPRSDIPQKVYTDNTPILYKL